MALGSKNNNGLYLKVVNAKIAQTVPEGTEGAVSRKLEAGPREGQLTHELMHDFVSGHIIGGDINKNQYGRTISIRLEDGDKNKYIFQIPWQSSMRDAFIKRIPNLRVKDPVEFNVFPDSKTAKPVLLIKQNGNNVPFFYTKEQPNGMPEWKKVKKLDEESWDTSEAESFMFEVATEFFEQFGGNEKPAHQGSSENTEYDEVEDTPIEDDSSEVPF